MAAKKRGKKWATASEGANASPEPARPVSVPEPTEKSQEVEHETSPADCLLRCRVVRCLPMSSPRGATQSLTSDDKEVTERWRFGTISNCRTEHRSNSCRKPHRESTPKRDPQGAPQ